MRKTCPDCYRPVSHCYCPAIERLNNVWPVIILQHKLEESHALGTARIAALSLSNCRLYQQSVQPFAPILWRDMTPLLVYPGEQATAIEEIDYDDIRPLVFIDASWRKSKSMLFEYPFLSALPRVTFTPRQASRYTIRKEPKPNYLSTIESIAYVLSILEMDEGKYLPLLKTMDTLIELQIASMGAETFERNYPKPRG